MEEIHKKIQEYAYDLNKRADQVSERIRELTVRIDNLKKGIKPYPHQVTALKSRLETGLYEQLKKPVDVRIFAELLEIRDASWQDAIEGYLDRQKFNLLVPEQYYRTANEIYNRIKKEEKIYDTGLVDLAKLKKEYTKEALKGSLAEEVETEDPEARLYADYLLGNVMKCENVRDLNRYRTAITKEVMLYKGYVSRRLNPARYADPFIGRRSLEILLKNLSSELLKDQKEYERIAEHHRIALKAASGKVMSDFEAQQHQESVRLGQEIPGLTRELEKLVLEYEGLDFTYLEALKKRIDEKKKKRVTADEEKSGKTKEAAKTEVRLNRIVEEDLPHVFDRFFTADRAHSAGKGPGLGLPPGLQERPGGEEPEPEVPLQPPALPAPQELQPVRRSHTLVSSRRAATTVIFSTTEAPRAPLSPILLHWQPP